MPTPIFSTSDGDFTVLPTWGSEPGVVVSLRIPGNSTVALAQSLTLDECGALGMALTLLATQQLAGRPRSADL